MGWDSNAYLNSGASFAPPTAKKPQEDRSLPKRTLVHIVARRGQCHSVPSRFRWDLKFIPLVREPDTADSVHLRRGPWTARRRIVQGELGTHYWLWSCRGSDRKNILDQRRGSCPRPHYSNAFIRSNSVAVAPDRTCGLDSSNP